MAGTVCLLAAWLVADAVSAADSPRIDFARDVHPILAARCFRCHRGSDASAGTRLDDRRELLGETTGVALVVSGSPRTSRLIERVTSNDPEQRMPPEGDSLAAREVDVLRRWIEQGVAWDESLLPPALGKVDHWAFRSVVRPDVPHVSDDDRAAGLRNPIDAFLAAQQQAAGVRFVGEAPRRTLIRRVSLDLIGLPPAPDEVEAFVADESPDAYERLVERLLASPRHGERWGRHWLDAARWAETEGYESNHPRPFAWRYRDWVVDAVNSDLPYDRFLRMQIAGDELKPYADENLIATGFLSAARLSSNEEDAPLQRNTVHVDVVNALGTAVLGLTVGCAQCHNHKFDPLGIRDYYRLQGYFVRGMPGNVALRDAAAVREYEAGLPPEYAPAAALKAALFESARARLVADQRSKMSPEARAALDIPVDRRTPAQELAARAAEREFPVTNTAVERFVPADDRPLYDAAKKKIEEIDRRTPRPQTFAFYSPVTSPHRLDVLPMLGFYPPPFDPDRLARTAPRLLVRGDVHALGPQLEAGWPEVFDTVFRPVTVPSASTPAAPSVDRRSRTALVDWLVDPRHPLTARVHVNRLWQGHFGRGLVPSADDFGVRGDPPTHPALLDWLASELVGSGWSTRHVHRLIVTSAAYRQASTSGSAADRDFPPSDDTYARWVPRRLEAEAIRDAALAVTGELQLAVGGPSVPTEQTETSPRRTLYLFQKRGAPPEMQALFDGPNESAESCARRHVGTSPLQALYLLDASFLRERAARLAEIVDRESRGDREAAIRAGFVRVVGREPDSVETEAARTFFARHDSLAPTPSDAARRKTLAAFCQALLNLDEFVFLE